MEILSAKQFNLLQDTEYKAYCNKCIGNNIKPEPQSRYFFKVSVNYGYVMQNRFGEVHWRKRKSDFAQ